MKILSMLLAAGSAVAFVSAAGAADLSSAPPLPPTFTPVAAAGYSWTGAYIGLHGGYSWSHSAAAYDDPNFPVSLAEFNPSGWLGGIEGGVNYQLSNNWVIGIELDAALAGIEDTVIDNLAIASNAPSDSTLTAKTNATGNIRGRLGYAFDRTLFFGTAGLTLAHTTISSSADPATDSATLIGWTVGAGVEQAITDRVSAKLEYQYTAFGNHTWFAEDWYASTGDSSASTVRAGLNYHF